MANPITSPDPNPSPVPANPNAPLPLSSLPANIAGMIPNPKAAPLSLQLRGLETPSQVIMNMLNRMSGSPLVPTSSPQAIASFWQGIGRQGATADDITPKKRQDDRYDRPLY